MEIKDAKQPTTSLVGKIYFSEFFSESLAVYALIPLLFEQYGGQSAERVGILLASWQILIVLFEIPTGIVADKYGRKASMQLARIARLLCFPLWLAFPSFTGLLAGIVFLALGDALSSGSLEAYSYDELEDKTAYNKLRQQTVAIHLAAFSAAGIYAFALNADFKLIIIASMISTSIGLFFSSMLPNDRHHHKQAVTIKTLLKDAKEQIAGHPVTLKRFVQASLMMTLLVFFIEQITLFYSDAGQSAKSVSALMAVGNLLTFGLLWILHSIEEWTRRYQSQILALCFILFGGAMASGLVWVQIGAIFLSVRLIRVAFLHTTNDLQHAVAGSARATISSLSSFVGKLSASAGIFLVGYLSRTSSDSRLPIYVIGTGFLTVFICLELFWRPQHGKR